MAPVTGPLRTPQRASRFKQPSTPYSKTDRAFSNQVRQAAGVGIDVKNNQTWLNKLKGGYQDAWDRSKEVVERVENCVRWYLGYEPVSYKAWPSIFENQPLPFQRGATPARLRKTRVVQEKEIEEANKKWAAEMGPAIAELGESLRSLPGPRVESEIDIFISSDEEEDSDVEEPSSPLSSTAHPPKSRPFAFDASVRIQLPEKKEKEVQTTIVPTSDFEPSLPGVETKTAEFKEDNSARIRVSKSLRPSVFATSGRDLSPTVKKHLGVFGIPDADELFGLKDAPTPKPAPPPSQYGQSAKDEFARNFKPGDSKSDKQKFEELLKYTGWTLKMVKHGFQENRFPNIKVTPVRSSKAYAAIAAILGDRSLMTRNGLDIELTFQEFMKVSRVERNDPALRTVVVPVGQHEPKPTTKVRHFTEQERALMVGVGSFGALQDEWRKQTIYDLEFHTPSDPVLPRDEIEFRDGRFEVARTDPRFRHMVTMMPASGSHVSTDRLQQRLDVRLQYKRAVSDRDWFFYKVISKVKAMDRDLAKVYQQYDLNRKRHEMVWDQFQRVRLVREEDANKRKESSAVRNLTPHPAKTVNFAQGRPIAKLGINKKLQEAAAEAVAQAPAGDKPKKKVTFVPGHTLSLYERPSSSHNSPEPEEIRPTKKQILPNGVTITTAKSALKSRDENTNPHPAVASNQPSILKDSKKRPLATTSSATAPSKPDVNPLKRRYMESLIDIPREWRMTHSGTFSAWEEDYEAQGCFYECDINDGKLPKGRGTWEREVEFGRGPKRVRVMREKTEQDFLVFDLEGTLRPLDWVPATTAEDADDEDNVEEVVAAAKPRPDQLPDLSNALRGLSKAKTHAEEVTDFASAASKDKGKEPEKTSKVPISWEEYQKAKAFYEPEVAKKQTDKDILASPAGFEAARSRRVAPTSADNKGFPVFNPFAAPSTPNRSSPVLSRSNSRSAPAPPSPPLSNEDENSGKEDHAPAGSKAGARLTGLFEPLKSAEPIKESAAPKPFLFGAPSSSSAPFKLAEDPEPVSSKIKPVNIFESFESNATAASATGSDSQPSQESSALRPVANDARLQRQSSTEAPKSLMPSAPITTAPTPAAPITAAEMGMFGAVKPSPAEKRALDEDYSGMDIDNTPLALKRTRTPPKPFGNVAAASSSMTDIFKPNSNPTSFNFSAMGGAENSAPLVVNNASVNTPFTFGGPAVSKPAEPVKFGAGPSSSSNLFGSTSASAAPGIFGAAEKTAPAQTPFLFGNSSASAAPAAAPKPAVTAPFQFGGAATSAPAPADKPFQFGGPATAAPATTGIFGASTATAPGLFGASTSAPASTGLFGATTTAPASTGLFGAVSGASAPIQFGAAPATSAPLFGAPAATAPSTTQSFGFGSNATSAPFGASQPATTSASFTFGQNTPAPATSQPLFGGELNKPATSASFNTGFDFGSNAPSPAPGGLFSFGGPSNAPSPAPQSSAAPLIFGATSAAATSAPGLAPSAVTFGGGSTPGAETGGIDFGFQAPANNGTLTGRNIKKPVSRKTGGSLRR